MANRLTGLITAVVFAGAWSGSLSARADPRDQVSAKIACPHIDGLMDGPFVPTPEVARKIYSAVSAEIAPWQSKANLAIDVRDEGDSWFVIQGWTAPQTDGSATTAHFGGGQLYMHISKCSGAISHVAFNR